MTLVWTKRWFTAGLLYVWAWLGGSLILSCVPLACSFVQPTSLFIIAQSNGSKRLFIIFQLCWLVPDWYVEKRCKFDINTCNSLNENKWFVSLQSSIFDLTQTLNCYVILFSTTLTWSSDWILISLCSQLHVTLLYNLRCTHLERWHIHPACVLFSFKKPTVWFKSWEMATVVKIKNAARVRCENKPQTETLIWRGNHTC